MERRTRKPPDRIGAFRFIFFRPANSSISFTERASEIMVVRVTEVSDQPHCGIFRSTSKWCHARAPALASRISSSGASAVRRADGSWLGKPRGCFKVVSLVRGKEL